MSPAGPRRRRLGQQPDGLGDAVLGQPGDAEHQRRRAATPRGGVIRGLRRRSGLDEELVGWVAWVAEDGRMGRFADRAFITKLEKAKTSIGLDNPKLYKDFRQLLASDVDAVIIATPVFLHAEHLSRALSWQRFPDRRL